jgi:hypothetical protein
LANRAFTAAPALVIPVPGLGSGSARLAAASVSADETIKQKDEIPDHMACRWARLAFT